MFVAFSNQRYYDFFSESVPLGRAAIEYGERKDWDEFTLDTFIHTGIEAFGNVSQFISRQFGSSQTSTEQAKDKAGEKLQVAKSMAAEKYKESKDQLKSVTTSLRTKVGKSEEKIVEQGKKTAAVAQHLAFQFSDGVEELIKKAEEALASSESSPKSQPATDDAGTIAVTELPLPDTTSEKKVYDGPLPLGHEPPYGFSRPAPPKKEPPVAADAAPALLPLVAPAVAELSISEPVIVQLASTIDNLASYLNSNPAAAEKAKDVLEAAKLDLTGLASRIETVKAEERQQLEKTLDEQAREYTVKLLELEMEAQDKIDSQEEGFRKFFDHERMNIVQAYREKLDHELKTQTELINER